MIVCQLFLGLGFVFPACGGVGFRGWVGGRFILGGSGEAWECFSDFIWLIRSAKLGFGGAGLLLGFHLVDQVGEPGFG